MIARYNWKDGLSRQERSELRELERKISLKERVSKRSIREQRELIYLKYQRQVIQNTASQRARRSVMEAAASA